MVIRDTHYTLPAAALLPAPDRSVVVCFLAFGLAPTDRVKDVITLRLGRYHGTALGLPIYSDGLTIKASQPENSSTESIKIQCTSAALRPPEFWKLDEAGLLLHRRGVHELRRQMLRVEPHVCLRHNHKRRSR